MSKDKNTFNNEKLICLIEIQRRKHIDVQCSFNDYTTMAMLKFSRFIIASMSDFAAFVMSETARNGT